MITMPTLIAAVDTSLVGILLGGLSVLSGVVIHLYKQVQSNTEAIKADLKECREDRERLWISIKEVAQRKSGEPDAKA
jgi:hypothetical protein